MQTLKDEVKNRIIEAAIKEFYLRGYEKASMRNIARTSGISVSNTYNYFENKEQLFNSIVGPVNEQVQDLLKRTVERYTGKEFGGSQFQAVTDSFIYSLLNLDARSRQSIIILTEKSEGTRFENTQERLIEFLEMHFVEQMNHGRQPSINELNQNYIMHVIATNFISGLSKILKDYQNQRWAEENMRIFLKYHLNGIKNLMS
jgi:AcrR family transcriptional regulator